LADLPCQWRRPIPSSVIGALRVQLGLDSAEFTSGAAKAGKEADILGTRIGAALSKPIGAAVSLKGAIASVGSALAIKELAGAAQRAFDYADAIQDLSDRTGASTKAIQEFRYAAQLSGSSVEVADAATEKFARTLGLAQQGSDAQVKLFRSLGVTSKDFDTALRQTLDGIAKLPTVQQRAAVGFQIFGKSSATLTGLLGQGSAGFDQLAARAQELGIVLEDDVIRNAGGANDKLDTMKMILNAQFANAVTQNATSIVGLADSIITLTGAVLKFLQSNPEVALAVIGGLAGSRAGPVGIATGAVVGYIAGNKLGQNADDQNTDLAFRRKQFRAAIANRHATQRADPNALVSVRRADGSRSAQSGTSAEVVRQGNLYKQAIAAAQAAKNPKAAFGALPTVGTGEAKTAAGAAKAAAAKALADQKREAAEAARAAKQARETEQRYQHELNETASESLRAQGDLTVELNDRVGVERALLANEKTTRLEAIDADERYTAAQKAALKKALGPVFDQREKLIDRNASEDQARADLDLARARNSNQEDLLHAGLNLARTSKERGKIELQLLDLQFKQLRAEQQAILDSATATKDQKTAASETIGTLNTLEPLARAKSAKDNAGPLAAYFDSIPKGADEMNEALESIQANGLSSLVDGLSDVEGGFKNLASTVTNVSNQIVAALLKIAVQKGLQELAGLLGVGGGGNSLTSSLSGALDIGGRGSAIDLTGSGLPKIAGARAMGGPVIGGRNYLVGERGPELFRAPGSGSIVANDDLVGGTGGGSGGVMEIRLRDELLDARIVSGSARVTNAGIAQENQRQSKYAGRRLGR